MEKTSQTESDEAGVDGEKGKPKNRVGILFVHGIGEQPRGDTLRRFGDPCISWLTRWLDRNQGDLHVSEVRTENGIPTSVTLTTGDKSDSSKPAIEMRESWWANRFTAPPIHELSWWLLLVGTWSILSHGRKSVWRSDVDGYFLPLAYLKVLFTWVPVAFLYQIAVILISLLGVVPFAPWRSYVTGLLIGLSKTLGDSYVLTSSPIQRHTAVAAVKKDIEEFRKVCDRLMVVAHSQGAAISYEALHATAIQEEEDTSQAAKKMVSFFSVGSGLDKLRGLERLSNVLEFRGTSHAPWYRRFLFMTPVLFVFFWAPLVFGLLMPNSVGFEHVLWIQVIVALFVFSISIGFRLKLGEISSPASKWIDIYASSDPVSNGPTKLRDKGIPPDREDFADTLTPIQITNERSLFQDHTTYFNNATDFLPRLMDHVRSFGQVRWIPDISNKIEQVENAKGLASRKGRKRLRRAAGWLNLAGLTWFLVTVDSGFTSAVEQINGSLLGPLAFVTTNELASDLISRGLAYWIIGGAIWLLCDLILRWLNRVSDRVFTNYFFSEEKFLLKLGRFLNYMIPVISGIWLLAIF